MVEYGKSTAFYSQHELEGRIDRVIRENKDRWKSRSAFINAAIYKYLREVDPSG